MTQTATIPVCSATIDGERIRLVTPFRLKELVKSLPGARWDAARKTWTVPATPAAAAVVESLTPHGLSAEPSIKLKPYAKVLAICQMRLARQNS